MNSLTVGYLIIGLVLAVGGFLEDENVDNAEAIFLWIILFGILPFVWPLMMASWDYEDLQREE